MTEPRQNVLDFQGSWHADLPPLLQNISGGGSSLGLPPSWVCWGP